jgi:hypothetical protein
MEPENKYDSAGEDQPQFTGLDWIMMSDITLKLFSYLIIYLKTQRFIENARP